MLTKLFHLTDAQPKPSAKRTSLAGRSSPGSDGGPAEPDQTLARQGEDIVANGRSNSLSGKVEVSVSFRRYIIFLLKSMPVLFLRLRENFRIKSVHHPRDGPRISLYIGNSWNKQFGLRQMKGKVTKLRRKINILS